MRGEGGRGRGKQTKRAGVCRCGVLWRGCESLFVLYLFLFFATLFVFVLYFIVVLCKLRGRCTSLLR